MFLSIRKILPSITYVATRTLICMRHVEKRAWRFHVSMAIKMVRNLNCVLMKWFEHYQKFISSMSDTLTVASSKLGRLQNSGGGEGVR